MKRKLLHTILTLIAAFFSSFALHVFVVPSDFSPSGIDGLSTILYEITTINIGWFKILINLPLLVLALIFLNRKYVIFVIIFTVFDSFGVVFYEAVGLFTYVPQGISASDAIAYRFVSALSSGVLLGISVGIMLKIGYSTGGVDIIAGLVHKWKPHFNIERLISICAYIIVATSFFVYFDVTSIILSIIQIFTSERVVAFFLKGDRYAVEVKIVTKTPEVIKDEILNKFKHSATIVKSNGMYSGDDNYIVFSVMNVREIPEFMNVMKAYPEAFVYFVDRVRVQGQYRFKDEEIGAWLPAFK